MMTRSQKMLALTILASIIASVAGAAAETSSSGVASGLAFVAIIVAVVSLSSLLVRLVGIADRMDPGYDPPEPPSDDPIHLFDPPPTSDPSGSSE